MTDFMIETNQLTKTYGDITAVDHMNWNVPAGSICGMLGPNGAGKTTTLKILLGMTTPTSGSALVRNLNCVNQSVEVRKISAFIPEDKMIYDRMKAEDFLRFYNSFFPGASIAEAERLLAHWNIPRDKKAGTLSKGNRGKLLVAAALSRKPELLIFDEPTDGLDPVAIEEVLSLIASWSAESNRTAVIASHRLDEVERICDRVTIVNNGHVFLSDDLDDLRSQWKTLHAVGDLPIQEISRWKNVHKASKEGMRSEIVVQKDAHSIVQQLRERHHVSNLEIHDMNLREIYLAAIGYKKGVAQ
jgi:ABC-2 type transport system ATP-binding protein